MSGDWQTTLLAAYGLVLLIWAIRLGMVLYVGRRIVVLSPRSPVLDPAGTFPRVSVLVPARNEADGIGACLESLLRLDYPNLEIIVIDDRSTDGTAAVVRTLAQRDPRLRLEQVRTLPNGWTGKTHALHAGVRHATGEWLLFVDADTQHHPLNLRVLLEYAQRERADLVSLLPGLRCCSFWEKVVQPFAGIVLMLFFPLPRINAERYPRSAFANGQYILVRRAAYERVGGHAAVRTHLLEDIQLGRVVKQAGGRIRVVVAPELSTTRMYASLGEIVRGWSRIFYAAVDHRPGLLVALMAAMLTLSVSAYAVSGLLLGLALAGRMSGLAWILLGMNLLHHGLIFAVLGPLYGHTRNRRIYLACYLLACLVMLVVLGRAVWLCFSHRVTWRGTAYGPELWRVSAAAESAAPPPEPPRTHPETG